MAHYLLRQQIALQAGFGVVGVGIILAMLGLFNVFQVQKLGRNISESAEDISLADLLARGADGNPHVWVRDFAFDENYVALVSQSQNKSMRPETWRYVLVAIRPTNQPGNPGTIPAIVRSNNVGSDARK